MFGDFKCVCSCHTNGLGAMHIAACCCEHGYVNHCPECKDEDE